MKPVQPFEQTDPSITRKFGGSSLGLAITRRLAQLMGGDAGDRAHAHRTAKTLFSRPPGTRRGVMPQIIDEDGIDLEEELRRQCSGMKILRPTTSRSIWSRQLLLHGVGLQVDSARATGAKSV